MSWRSALARANEEYGQGASDSGLTCPAGQFEADPGDCRPCAFSALALWAVLACSGVIVCGVVWWLGNVALGRIAAAKSSGSTGAGAGQLLAHGAGSGVQMRHAMVTFSTTTTSFQFLFLFQIHLTWPAMVTDAWHWLTEIASLAWLRLEFLFTAIKPLCANQYVPQAAILLAPFIGFSVIYCCSRVHARRKENQVSDHAESNRACERACGNMWLTE